jgi:hypothetical protein
MTGAALPLPTLKNPCGVKLKPAVVSIACTPVDPVAAAIKLQLNGGVYNVPPATNGFKSNVPEPSVVSMFQNALKFETFHSSFTVCVRPLTEDVASR